jgi:hypothetical protein
MRKNSKNGKLASIAIHLSTKKIWSTKIYFSLSYVIFNTCIKKCITGQFLSRTSASTLLVSQVAPIDGTSTNNSTTVESNPSTKK